MNAPFPSPLMAGQLILRVLAGRSKGAEHRLPQGKYIRIGHAFDHDVVVRDESTKGLSLELHLGTDVATVRIVAGGAALLGRPIAAGEEASLPAYVPLSLGDFAVAIGEAESERWAEVERLSTMIAPASSEPAAAAPQAALTERLTTRLYPLREVMTGDHNWPLYGLLAGGLLLLAIGGGPVTRWIGGQFNGIENHKTVLAGQGFGGLTVSDGATGQGPVITGVVRDDAELSRLRALVAARIGNASIDVDTMQGMAAAATDMLRAQGIDADAKPMRGNSLLVTTEFLPADRQDELIKLLRRDLPGITRVAFATQNSRGDRDLQYFFSGSAYGLATFVDGMPGYIVTADGTHWFTGSQVPTGHKIIAIGNGRASFERDGRIEELMLGAPPSPASTLPTPTPINSETKERTQL
jgi:type III secretion protein D